MNKTININLGGYFFYIDEDAYHKLNNYLNAISNSLKNDPGKSEIIADIESRISELLSEKITNIRQVVKTSDIEKIILIMGQPEDYIETDDNYSDYTNTKTKNKKLFRDSENKILGGVCSGLTHYFGVDEIWIRLLFIALVASGFSLLFYIILWVIIPTAKTTSEKLQMKGEPVNINNIEKKIKEDLNNITDNIKNSTSNVTDKVSNINYTKVKEQTKTGIQEITEVALRVLNILFKISIKILAVFFIIGSSIILLSLTFSALSLNKINVLGLGYNNLSNLFLTDTILPNKLIIGAVLFVIIIPLIAFIIIGIQILSPTAKKINVFVRRTLLAVWIACITITGLTLFDIHSQSAYDGANTLNQTILTPNNQTIEVLIANNDNLYYKKKLISTNNSKLIINSDNKKIKYSNNVSISIEKSETSENYIQIIKKSKGRTTEKANANAKKIDYKFKTVDNKIIFDAYFLSLIKNLTKEEGVEINIYLTEGEKINLKNSSKNFLKNIKTTNNIDASKLTNHNLIMTKNGLHCYECN